MAWPDVTASTPYVGTSKHTSVKVVKLMPYQPCSYEEAETSGSAESASDVDDEELARRLQSEEHNALYQRMLEMSGFGEHYSHVI